MIPLWVEEHRQHESYCAGCDKVHYGVLPPVVVHGGLLGPHLTALVAYLKGVCHASFSTVRKFLRDVVGLTISRGMLAKVAAKVSAALERPYQELLERLPDEDRLNVDETGHKDRGDLLWTWCFRAELYTLFKIAPHRSADVLLEVLGTEFDGVLGCDCFSAYRRYMRECNVLVQFCLAHLIRDVKYLTTLPDRRDQAYGERLREALRDVVWGDPPAGATVGRGVRAAVAGGAGRGATAGDPRRAADGGRGAVGEAADALWGELFPVRDHSGDRADEQRGGASDPLRGDRPPHHAGHAE